MTALNFHKLQPLFEGTLGVASINCFGAISKPRCLERAQNLVEKILPAWQKQGLGIVAFQEAFRDAEIVPAKSGYANYCLETERQHWWQVAHSGLGIASQHPIVGREFRGFGARKAWVRFSNTGVQLVKVDHPQLGEVSVINTHLQSSFNPDNPMQNDDVRLRQMREDLSPFLGETSGKNSLVVVTGDLNHNPTVVALKKPRSLFERLAAKLKISELFGKSPGARFTPEYDYLVNGLKLADATRAVAEHMGISAENIYSFGAGVLAAEAEYAAAGFRLLFDRVHIGTTNPRHRVVVDLSQSRIEFEDTGSSDHRAVKMWLGISIYDMGTAAELDNGPRVIFANANRSQLFASGAERLVA